MRRSNYPGRHNQTETLPKRTLLDAACGLVNCGEKFGEDNDFKHYGRRGNDRRAVRNR
jgi:hypothetical protein